MSSKDEGIAPEASSSKEGTDVVEASNNNPEPQTLASGSRTRNPTVPDVPVGSYSSASGVKPQPSNSKPAKPSPASVARGGTRPTPTHLHRAATPKSLPLPTRETPTPLPRGGTRLAQIRIPPSRNVTARVGPPSEPTSSPAFRYDSAFPTSPAAGDAAGGNEMEVDSPDKAANLERGKRKTMREIGDLGDANDGPSRKKSKPAASEKEPRKTLLASKRTGSASNKSSALAVLSSKKVVGGSKKGGEAELVDEVAPPVIPAVPEGAPKYVVNALGLCAWVEGDECWVKLVQHWLRFDQEAGFKPTSKELARLPTSGRPSEVGTWISHARSAMFRPEVVLPRFADEFAAWWKGMQPEGRDALDEGFMSLTTQATTDWTELRVSGPNGMVNVIGALAWWRKAVYALPKENVSKTGRSGQKRELELQKLNDALKDVSYVLGQLLK